MKVISSRLLASAAVLAVVCSAPAHAGPDTAGTVSPQQVEAKFTYCRTCHGVQAQGFRGAFPIPRLAGQQPQYIMNQLHDFIAGRRKNAVMFSVAHVLRPAMVKALAEKFHKLNPKPLGGAPKALMPKGKLIFDNGVPSADVPPCQSCHGPDAKGNGQFPRLAGQLNDYIIHELENWPAIRGEKKTAAIMAPIAHKLTKPQIEAVAAYLSSLD